MGTPVLLFSPTKTTRLRKNYILLFLLHWSSNLSYSRTDFTPSEGDDAYCSC